MNPIFKADKERGSSKHAIHFLYFKRLAEQSNNKIILLMCKIIMKYYTHQYGLEIAPHCRIGKGLYLGHAYNITINPQAIIGDYCNIHKGVTIGQENRGDRKGFPTIGNKVWIGVNATIVGNIKIGDDVLIAPNSFVNKDIPSHSIVFGNPCIVKSHPFATEYYI